MKPSLPAACIRKEQAKRAWPSILTLTVLGLVTQVPATCSWLR